MPQIFTFSSIMLKLCSSIETSSVHNFTTLQCPLPNTNKSKICLPRNLINSAEAQIVIYLNADTNWINNHGK